MMSARVLTGLVLGLSLPGLALAEEAYRYGRIRVAEPGVILQRATDTGAETAEANMPFLPGDRVWTDDRGRLEVQLADGSVLRLDGRSKLDYAAHEGGRRAERAVLRLWSGALYLHYRDGRRSPEITIDTPEGVFEPEERGVYRIDVAPGEARLMVLDGEGTVEANRRVRASRGERVLVREGEVASGPEPFDRAEADDEFARWDEDQHRSPAYAGARADYVPEEVGPYAGELWAHGDWQGHPEHGWVWYPRVDHHWRPYTHGHWAWTAYGWTWIPNEPWGWAPSHYGRWGWAPRGWYWIPGRSWGPAWVSWAVGGDHVGWCPLGWGDRPVVIYERGRRVPKGHAVPRGNLQADLATSPWFYVRRSDMGARDLARRRAQAAALRTDQLLAAAPRARLSRDLRLLPGGATAREAAVPRHVRTKPTPGDTVPELRGDPTTTIRRAIPRRRREPEAPPEAAQEQREGAPPGAFVPRKERDAQDAREAEREVLRPLFGQFGRRREPQAERGEESARGGNEPRGEAVRPRPRERDEGWRSGSEGAARPRSSGAAPREGGWSKPRGEASRPAAPPPAPPQAERAQPRSEGARTKERD